METRANYVLIGLFTLAVIVGAFGFVYWFHHVGGVARAATITASCSRARSAACAPARR